jgi:hypothetical protein
MVAAPIGTMVTDKEHQKLLEVGNLRLSLRVVVAFVPDFSVKFD